MMKTAIISGITGQDGAYLSQFLLKKGYRLIGLTRSYSKANLAKLRYLEVIDSIEVYECDLTDLSQIIRIISTEKPDEFYNLASQSSVGLSFQQPIGTIHFNIISLLNILEAIKVSGADHIKVYQASSSEMYGLVKNLPIREDTPMHPVSPYGISKASAHWIAVNYREAYGLQVACGILFNHESYLRSHNFFIKKVLRESILISRQQQEVLKVGNIDIKRDFGYAPKYVEAMWLMLQEDTLNDYTICSGTSILLRSIIEHIFSNLGISLDRLVVDKSLYRPTDIVDIYGDNAKAKSALNWNYDLHFLEVIDLLLEEELRHFRN